MNKIIVTLVALGGIFVFFNASNSNEGTTASNTLIVGTNAEYPPYSFMEGRTIVGFDIDVAKEAAKRLGKQIELRDMPFEALLSELTLKKIDLVAAGMTPTKERAQRVAFVTPHYIGNQLAVVSLAENHLQSLENLKGRKVVVNDGYTADTFASTLEGINILRLPAPSDALIALNSKRADAFITELNTVKEIQKNQAHHTYSVFPIGTATDGTALVVNKSSEALLSDLNKAIDEMQADGTMTQIKSKWGL